MEIPIRINYQIVITSYFARDFKQQSKRNPETLASITKAREILQKDPYNKNKQCNIKKLQGIKQGEGQYRLRLGKYRLRYDICGHDVVLYSFRHRKDAY